MSKYRPDIDGLRMVAIVPVVLYHAGLPFLSGGYVGVDVFFVISGFLITRILHEEITQDRFSLVGFYERRVRRILPALIVVILATLLAGFMILPPEEFANLANSAIAASVFSSNIWFWIKTSD
jgi:peptidoglycan/LPS O-acetylase OafA/YrhL